MAKSSMVASTVPKSRYIALSIMEMEMIALRWRIFDFRVIYEWLRMFYEIKIRGGMDEQSEF